MKPVTLAQALTLSAVTPSTWGLVVLIIVVAAIEIGCRVAGYTLPKPARFLLWGIVLVLALLWLLFVLGANLHGLP